MGGGVSVVGVRGWSFFGCRVFLEICLLLDWIDLVQVLQGWVRSCLVRGFSIVG